VYERILNLGLAAEETVFLWGPRQTGKSTLLRKLFPRAPYYDLLQSDVYRRLTLDPGLVREECDSAGLTGATQTVPVVIDEVQMVPAVLPEVHWLIENRGLRFVLCGSSARKLKRGGGNLLGGRALRCELFPLVYREIPDFDIVRALNRGLIPRHYPSPHASRMLQSYTGDYLKEEIAAESLTRNLPAFSRFLEVSALSSGEILNYTNIAAECGVSAPTVKEYYGITVDTLLGRYLPAFRKKAKRRQILAPKFYYFDTGVVAHLARRGEVRPGSELFGKAFEQFIVNEVFAHASYSGKLYPISYWRSVSGFEVDLVLGDHEIAVEAKSADITKPRHLKGLRAFREDFTTARSIVVSLDPRPRKTDDGVEILPWRLFLDRLWDGEII
jgi:predicted AAA+ superfamily ATPase